MNENEKQSVSWYAEETGAFGQGYFQEYAEIIAPEKTKIEVDFIEKVLNLKRGMKILDIACGHGRHTINFARRGYTMTGQDINPFFLKEAKKVARQNGVEVCWVKSDMRYVPFKNEFDVVVNLFTSFGYLESDEEDQKVLHQIAKALRIGGKFVIDFVNRERIMGVYKEKEWKELADGTEVLYERKFDLITGRNQEKRLRIYKDGRKQSFHLAIRMYTLTELINMCKNAGLQFQEVYGDYNGELLTIQSRRYILLCKKI